MGADTLRLATWHVELTRRGPGILLRDLLKGDDPAVNAVTETLNHVAPDVLLLTGIDWDYDLAALNALAQNFKSAGHDYPHLFAAQPNSGLRTELDLDGDGRIGGPGDSQGFGRFSGQGGMALLSRLPFERDKIRVFSDLLWKDLPNATLPEVDGAPFPSVAALDSQRLSSVAHWDVPLRLAQAGPLHILAFSAGPPVFDGPEDRNGLRNQDEIRLWLHYLNGTLEAAPQGPVVVMGNANLDPVDGDGLHQAINDLRTHPRLQDPEPRSPGATLAATQGGANDDHQADPALDTADWNDAPGPGNLRVSYVLPDKGLRVTDTGVFWPVPDSPLAQKTQTEDAPRHHLVWVDIDLTP